MGLPAFDMSAIEAAKVAVAGTPRASTSVLFGPGVRHHAQESVFREQIRQQTNSHIEHINKWRSNALFSTIAMRDSILQGMIMMPLPHFHEISVNLKEHEDDIARIAEETAQLDRHASIKFRELSEEIANKSQSAGRFLRGEMRRLDKAYAGRQETYVRIGMITSRLRRAIETYAAKQSLPAFISTEAGDIATYAERVTARAADLEGVSRRTADLLKRFPKTAAYLAR